jgi:glycosyltransferase involved in cell wall biosynthesis
MSQYVCAFRGRRDNYQVPLALAEAGLLDQFITDFYSSKSLRLLVPFLPLEWQRKIDFRICPDIPHDRVKCLWASTLKEHVRHTMGWSAAKTYAAIDPIFSQHAAERASLTRSNLFLYTPYAWEAFQKDYSHSPHRILFQFHPHAETEEVILKKDFHEFPQVEKSYREEIGRELPPSAKKRERECWQYADLTLCASSFTRSTLIHAGADSKRCQVLPYGVDLPIISNQAIPDNFQILFVGSGIQRKGLHHLLSAWQRAKLPSTSKFILVCRTIDPGIRAMVDNTPSIQLLQGVDAPTLGKLYESSSLFVMPSLVEGFGQVFLEALSYGCPVLGTVNTCLPDLGDEADGIFLVNVGDLNHLVNRLEHLATWIPSNPHIRQKARGCAEKFSWQTFRQSLRHWVQSL